MFFTDRAFFIFLPLVVLTFWLLSSVSNNENSNSPRRFVQPLFLVLASYIFYGFRHPWFILLLLGTTSINYFAALLIERYPAKRAALLSLCCIVSLSILFYFKYAGFLLENLKLLFPNIPLELHVFLPAAISFFTFHALSYTIDVYRGELKPERNFIRFCLFLCFFPLLVAGPIERAHNLLAQLQRRREFNWATMAPMFFSGIDLLFLGFFKKVVIADNVALYVNMIFDLRSPSTLMALTGAFGFAIQILADFSGYTDIARGCARLMGFELMENFRHPYLARTPAEFWQRWHISLSTWIRDYLYIPLGGSHVSTPRWLANMLAVWFLCGLWHGASWNYVLWGLYWGMLIIIYRFVRVLPQTSKLDPLRVLTLFLFTLVGWLLFRVKDLSLLRQLTSHAALAAIPAQLPVTAAVFLIFLFYATPLVVGLAIEKPLKRLLTDPIYSAPTRIIGYAVIGLLITVFIADNPEEFYYFQF